MNAALHLLPLTHQMGGQMLCAGACAGVAVAHVAAIAAHPPPGGPAPSR